MSLKSGYPKRHNLYDLGSSNFSKDINMWKESRGFIPSLPLSFIDEFQTQFLVVPLYSDEKLLSYQLRDINDEETETKYKFTKPVYDSFVKTDKDEIPGRKVICEGTMDCMLLREHGVNAFTCLGLKKFKIIRMLEELEGEQFLYVLDNDSYGKFFAKRYLSKQGLGVNTPPTVKDVNDLFKSDKSLFLSWLNRLKKLTLA